MSIQIATPSTGTSTLVGDLKPGQRVLIGVDTKKVLNVTTKDRAVYLKIELPYGKVAYRTFAADRTLFVY